MPNPDVAVLREDRWRGRRRRRGGGNDLLPGRIRPDGSPDDRQRLGKGLLVFLERDRLIRVRHAVVHRPIGPDELVPMRAAPRTRLTRVDLFMSRVLCDLLSVASQAAPDGQKPRMDVRGLADEDWPDHLRGHPPLERTSPAEDSPARTRRHA